MATSIPNSRSARCGDSACSHSDWPTAVTASQWLAVYGVASSAWTLDEGTAAYNEDFEQKAHFDAAANGNNKDYRYLCYGRCYSILNHLCFRLTWNGKSTLMCTEFSLCLGMLWCAGVWKVREVVGPSPSSVIAWTSSLYRLPGCMSDSTRILRS